MYQFINNNHASFHLWWKESLLNQKVSKYYGHDCSYRCSSFLWNLISKLYFSLRSGEKYWLLSNVWNLLKVQLPHTVLLHYLSWPKHPSESDYFNKGTQTIRLKTWNLLRVEVVACGISLSELEKAWNLQGWSTKKPYSLVLLFGPEIFKGCNTLLWNHTCYDLRFFQNFQDKPRDFSGVFTKIFP